MNQFQWIDNCAVGVYNIDSTSKISIADHLAAQLDKTKMTAFCLECKKGYRKINNIYNP